MHAEFESRATVPIILIKADFSVKYVHDLLADVKAPVEVAFIFLVINNEFLIAILCL